MIDFNPQNVLDSNGITITITGMLIVFSGLLLISLFIIILPHALARLDRLLMGKTTSQPVVTNVPEEPSEQEIMAAISLAIHMELERCGGDLQRITMQRRTPAGTFWNSAGKVRSLSNRSPHA